MEHAVIIAGGGGTRFWPRSRAAHPKQFLTLTGDRSLLQQTFDRVDGQADHVWVVTAERYSELTAEQLSGVDAERIVGEPCGRDTAPCIGLAAALIAKDDPNGVMIVAPADHVIEPMQEFHRAILAAKRTVEETQEALVVFGVAPSYPATGYGYIESGESLPNRQGTQINRVAGFREKPDAATAAKYVGAGRYFWNCGIFVWRAQTLLDQLQQHQPRIHAAVRRIAESWNTPDRERVFTEAYDAIDRISIDHAILERAQTVVMIHAPFQWDDVGAWLAVERLQPQDAGGNTIQGNHEGINTSDCIIVGDNDRLIATAGVRDLIIVQDGDSVLIADKDDESAIKNLVEHLRKQGKDKYL